MNKNGTQPFQRLSSCLISTFTSLAPSTYGTPIGLCNAVLGMEPPVLARADPGSRACLSATCSESSYCEHTFTKKSPKYEYDAFYQLHELRLRLIHLLYRSRRLPSERVPFCPITIPLPSKTY